MIVTEIRFQRATKERWLELDPVLDYGEPGYEDGVNGNGGRLKIGDGIHKWSDLNYVNYTETDIAALNAHVNSPNPHPVYDEGPSLTLLYNNAKV